MEQLKFGNPVFHEGLNTTVRLGSKWFDLFDEAQEEFERRNASVENPPPFSIVTDIAHPDSTPTGERAVIEAAEVGTFLHMLASALELEHDPACQTLQGLYNGMKTPYGDKFNAGSTVTVLYFTVIKAK